MKTILFLTAFVNIVLLSVGLKDSNLLFIICDELRADYVSGEGRWLKTPNIDRLASKSVTFDLAFAQIAVCNPSRDSLLTGLRPDTVGTHGFQSSFRPHRPFPQHLKDLGFSTTGIGKVLNWDGPDSAIWSNHYDFNSEDYLGKSNGGVLADDSRDSTTFADYKIATQAIKELAAQSKLNQRFLIAVGFKSLNIPLRAPSQYFQHIEMAQLPKVSKDSLTFPHSTPIEAYRSGGEGRVQVYKKGTARAVTGSDLSVSPDVQLSLTRGYGAVVSFVDEQIGRILNAVDRLALWKNLTVILTSDHGVHTGEKGIWEKWTLFDESTRVPLMIHHPLSPFKGQHYSKPVELIDIFPTIVQLLNVKNPDEVIHNKHALQGKSLASIVISPVLLQSNMLSYAGSDAELKAEFQAKYPHLAMPKLRHQVSLSQTLLCSSAKWSLYFDDSGAEKIAGLPVNRIPGLWVNCDVSSGTAVGKVVLMGYSLRSAEYRYTAYLRLDSKTLIPLKDMEAWAEELYDHRGGSPGSASPQLLAKLETENLADNSAFQKVLLYYRKTLLSMLRTVIVYKNGVHVGGSNQRKAEMLKSRTVHALSHFSIEKFFTTDNSTSKVSIYRQNQKQRHESNKNSITSNFHADGNYGKNVLFIMYDDLRPELSIYGKSHMITPNFERLAAKSVVFDLAITQVAVCNPSRNCLLTGLRPDTVRSYAFESHWDPNLIIPMSFKRLGYTTAQSGKILHWDGQNNEVWDSFFDWDWYKYQNAEWDSMKSTVMPDKTLAEDKFPDYLMASEAIKSLRNYHANNEKFFVAVGFKMPHTALHIPYRYFDMYRNVSTTAWVLSDEERQFPITAPMPSYRCCADTSFRFMKNEGADRADRYEPLQQVDKPISQGVYSEMMWGYSAAISYIDTQLGRVLDVLDELNLWQNLTVVLTADHGMHNGEKGLWEKWTLFDESTRVPLMIHHPQSPFKGQHYRKPVELIDIFPTLHDLVGAPINRVTGLVYNSMALNPSISERPFKPLSGRSLAPMVLGAGLRGLRPHHAADQAPLVMPTFNRTFGMSQVLKCFDKVNLVLDPLTNTLVPPRRAGLWSECDMQNTTRTDQLAMMGYSCRSVRFRYTAWLEMDRKTWKPKFDVEEPYAEELYDHRGEKMSDLGRMETVNVADSDTYREVVRRLRNSLFDFLKNEVIYSPY